MTDDLRTQLGKVLSLPTNDPVLDQLLNLLSDWQTREVSVDEARSQLEQDPKLRPMQSLVSFEGAQVTGGLTIGDVAGNNVIKVQGIFVNLHPAAAVRPQNFIPLPGSSLFQPRSGEFKRLEELLFESRGEKLPPRVGLVGMGGVGKTQLAVELAYRCVDQHRYPGGVFWMNATGKDVFDWQHQLAALAADTDYLPPNDNLGSPENERRRARHLCKYLADHQDALLILDNVEVEDPSLVLTALPALAGGNVACSLLYTSRITLQPEGITIYPVEQLSDENALRLLLQETRQTLLAQIEAGQLDKETENAQNICQSVGYLPLALIQLRGLLRSDMHLTLARLQQVLTQRGALNLVQALSSTFSLSWEQVQGEEAQRLFKLACYFPEAVRIPLWLLGLAANLGESGDIFEPLGKALLHLQKLSLLEKLPGEQVQLHPLVRDFGQQLVVKGDDKGIALLGKAGKRLANACLNLNWLEQRTQTRGYWECLDQVRAMRNYAELLGTADEAEQIGRVEHWLDRESYLLADNQWWPNRLPGLFYQQLINRSVEEGHLLEVEKAPTRWLRQENRVGAENQALLRIFAGHSQSVMSVAFSPDGTKALTGSHDETACLWEVASGKLLQTFKGHTRGVESVAFSPDGTKVLTGSGDETARLWEVASGNLLHSFLGHTGAVHSVAFSPDGTKVLTGSGDETVRLWEAASGNLLQTLEGDLETVWSVAFSPDGTKLLAGSHHNTPWLWEAVSGKPLQRLLGNMGSVLSVAFSPDGTKLLAGAGDSTARLLEAVVDEALLKWGIETVLYWYSPLQSFLGHTDSVWSVAYSPDGTKVLTGSGDQTARLWETASGKPIQSFLGHTGAVHSVAFSPDGTKVLTGSGDETVRLWEAASGKPQISQEGYNIFWVVVFSPDGTKVLTNLGDQTARLWEAANGKLLQTFKGHTNQVDSMAFSPDGTKVLTGSRDGTARLWEVASGKRLQTFKGYTHKVMGVAFTSEMRGVAFSPDGTKVLTGSGDGTVQLWEVASGKLLQTFKGHTDQVDSVAFSPDGTKVLTGSGDGTARLWEGVSGRRLQMFEGRTSYGAMEVAFSPDGTKVLTGSYDGTVQLWEAASGKLLQSFLGHTGAVERVVFSPDGHIIVTSDKNGRVLLWQACEPKIGLLLGIYDATYKVEAIHWRDTTHVLLADTGGPSHRLHIYRLKLEGRW